MKSLCLLVLFLLGSQQRPLDSTQVQPILVQVANAPGLAPFLTHYRQRPLYFRFLPTTQYPSHAFQDLILPLQQGGVLVYNETKDPKRYPVLEFRLVTLQASAAEVRVAFEIEGVMGHFTLRKAPHWHLSSADVAER